MQVTFYGLHASLNFLVKLEHLSQHKLGRKHFPLSSPAVTPPSPKFWLQPEAPAPEVCLQTAPCLLLCLCEILASPEGGKQV